MKRGCACERRGLESRRCVAAPARAGDAAIGVAAPQARVQAAREADIDACKDRGAREVRGARVTGQAGRVDGD